MLPGIFCRYGRTGREGDTRVQRLGKLGRAGAYLKSIWRRLRAAGERKKKAAGRGWTRILRGGELSTALIIRADKRGMAVKITRRLILDIFSRGGQVPAPGACMERWFAVGLGYAFFSGIRELFKNKINPLQIQC